MSNFHRIIWIDQELKLNRYPTRQQIADEFEISVRQAARDIEYMKYSMGVPIEYSSQKKGYYYSDKTFTLPTQYITEKDKQVFQYLAHQYSNYGQGQASQIAELFQRLAWGNSSITKSNLPVFILTDKEKDTFNHLHDAINNSKKIKITYRNSHYELTQRIFCPYHLFYKNNQNYVVGFCELRQEERIFRLDRISNIKILEESYSIRPEFDKSKYTGDVNFIYFKPYTATVFFEIPPRR